ncbi:MAG: hypothetical protein BWK79_18635 [Beggiatoa sp. IS2]|nr:MAG: hypothetical protein BWK79_18635 [Beggiatoa sp. IS2]
MSCTGTSVSISETFKGSTGELLCQPATLSLSSVAGTLTDQHIVCTFNQCGETTPVEVSTPITCDDSHLDQCTTQEQCESIGKYWYSEKCNTTPEITSKPGNVTLPTGESKTSLSSFTGGLAISGGNRQPSATLNLADPVEVSGNIMIDQAHVGQTADLFVYAETTIPINPYTLYFMLKGKPVLEILMWDKKPKNLVAFKDNVILETEQQIFMYQGQFIYPGTLKVYFGYRLTDGTLVTSGESIDVTIN